LRFPKQADIVLKTVSYCFGYCGIMLWTVDCVVLETVRHSIGNYFCMFSKP
jgi:hypothetical protein